MIYEVELETSGFDDEELQNFLKFNNVHAAETSDKTGNFPVYRYRCNRRLILVKMILTFWQTGDDETDQEMIESIKEVNEKKFHVEIMDMPYGKFIHSRVDGNVIGNFSISEAREFAMEARRLAKALLRAAQEMDGNECLTACFKVQGRISHAHREELIERVEAAIEESNLFDGVEVL